MAAVAHRQPQIDETGFDYLQHNPGAAMLTTILIGLVLGFVAAIPLAGPVALLIFSRAVAGRPIDGVFIGIGSAVAEAVYATLAFWGFSTFLTQYEWIEPASKILSAAILIVLGVVFARGPREKSKDQDDGEPKRDPGPQRGGSLFVGFTLTVLNPTLIGMWAVVATTLFSMDIVAFEPIRSLPFGLSVGVGIALWYFVLVELLTHFKRRFKPAVIPKITRWLGVGFAVLGLYLAISLLVQFA